MIKIQGKQTVSQVLEKYSATTDSEMRPLFSQAGIQYPPTKLALITFKDERLMHLWAANDDVQYQLIVSYPVLAASGKLGPKLREGDRQVPEGMYRISGLNPNSSYHLSMKLDYPNQFDLKHAKIEGRTEPGSNIFIHGRARSIGCLAMGDEVIERLFTLVNAVGLTNTQVIIAPSNPARGQLVSPADAPTWVPELYRDIELHYAQLTEGFDRA
ncbi:L,D-transpeptidase family protein [Arenicella xantha]|uniref:L,D-transpeptidase family protein n=1 Tax=Arenicella xantha TaxID=644221 RepID=UPI001B8805A8|nr:L,D-transpeptidase family protein [Arenicella xantha]